MSGLQQQIAKALTDRFDQLRRHGDIDNLIEWIALCIVRARADQRITVIANHVGGPVAVNIIEAGGLLIAAVCKGRGIRNGAAAARLYN